MLTIQFFDKCFGSLLYFHQVPVDEQMSRMYYKLLCKDFDDAEFSAICGDICKHENLYNKYPIPKLFYDRKQSAKETILVAEGSLFIDDTMPQYRAVIDDLDQDTRDRVCNQVAEWLFKNKLGEMVSEEFIIQRLKQFRPMPKEDSFEEISDERIKGWISTSIKTIP